MASKMFLSDFDLESLCALIKKQFQSAKFDGIVSVSQDMCKDDRKAKLHITPVAFAKMSSLVAAYSTEVEWHGLARRLSENEFEINDILVFPHEVTGTTVISDQKEYEKWLDELDDETFNALKFHGHSHVNMDVDPSSVDMGYREKMLSLLPDNEEETNFYIFLIMNKRHEWSAEIYDVCNNAVYDTKRKEIEITVDLGSGQTTESFVAEAKKVVKTSSYQTGAAGYSYYGKGYQASVSGYNPKDGFKPAGTSKQTAAKTTTASKANDWYDYADDYDPFGYFAK